MLTCLGISGSTSSTLFICFIQSKAERVKWVRGKKTQYIENDRRSAILDQLVREGFFAEVTFEQRADQLKSKPCNYLGNEYFQLGNNKGKDLKILLRESVWSIQKTV